jgi:hypothetical protein
MFSRSSRREEKSSRGSKINFLANIYQQWSD